VVAAGGELVCGAARIRFQMANNASFAEAASVAVGSLRTSKLRSFLTLLGIILATATLIAVMAVINGMDEYVAQQVSDMGSDGFRIRRLMMFGRVDPKKFLERDRRNPEMSREEFHFVRQNATLVREIGMEAFRRTLVKYGTQKIDGVQIIGVTSNMGAISNTQLSTGRFVSEVDDRRRLAVAVIGNDLKQEFFSQIDPIGKTISIEGRPFEVIGVAKAKGSAFGNSQDSFAMIPVETYFKIYGFRKVNLGYNAVAVNANRLNEAMDEVRSLLRSARHQRPSEEDTFDMAASESLVGAWQRLTGAIAASAMAVVSVFMVVGGVVIMNIMLAVVTERTHEIGIRKAIGARRRDIMNQFLVESSMLAASGGMIGVLLAWGVAVLVRNTTPVPMAVPPAAVVVGVGLSALVGLFFGIYPARRAARMDPIEALRHE
jgi:putative ABC transport system permease protein